MNIEKRIFIFIVCIIWRNIRKWFRRMVKLTRQMYKKRKGIFIPNEHEMEAIYFLNCLPEMSYRFIPDFNEVIFDFDILREERDKMIDDLQLLYEGKLFSMKDFIEKFEDEVSFYLILE